MVTAVLLLGGLLAASTAPALAQTDNGEWRSYGGDIANTRYAPLDRITAGNFKDLEIAWSVKTANFGPEPEFNFQSTPLMVGGVLYSTAGSRRAAIAMDAGTGELLWMHRLNESWRYTGNAGVWGQISADLELGIVYLPTEMPTNDYYGGHRHGDNLFSDSIVAVDIDTGERLWHFQAVHHDVWDWDFPCAPVLVDVVIDGVERKLIAQPSKQAWLYVLDRETGEPIWPIEEREVEQSDVPGELLSLTQPFPTRPPPYDRQGVDEGDLIDFTPELHARALELVSNFRLGPIFTPPVVADPEGPYATLMLPSAGGGASWPRGLGRSGDRHLLPVLLHPDHRARPCARPGALGHGLHPGNPPGVPARRRTLSVRGLPLVKPPWGRISAIDLKTGDILWQIPHGETPDNVRDHPALRGVDIPRTGRVGRVGTLITKSLLIAAEPGTFTTPSGEEGAMLRAYDKASGEEVGAVYMPAGVSGSPMTYLHEGRQHLVMAIGGGGFAGELIAYRLPE